MKFHRLRNAVRAGGAARLALSWLLSVTVPLILAACGGGGGGSSTSPGPPQTQGPAGDPSASITAPASVTGLATVTLDGSASTDSTSTISSYAWAQTSGPSVALNDATTAGAHFIAPTVTSATTLSFQLIVTDALGASASSNTTVTVIPPESSNVAANLLSVTFLRAVVNNPHNDATPTDTPPLAGSPAIVEVALGGAIATVAFAIQDALGNSLGPLDLSLSGDTSQQPLDYAGTFLVPAAPFYVVAQGATGDGQAFRLLSQLITPLNMALGFQPADVRLARGAAMSVSLLIKNAGPSATFTVAAQDTNGLLAKPLTSSLQVSQGQSVSIPVAVSMPNSLTGSYSPQITVTASVSGDPSRTTTTSFTAWLDGAP
jgi:hypothetical protein